MPHSEPDVLIKRLDPGVPLPSYAHPGDAGADLATAEDVELGPGERALVRTGLAIALPDGYAAFVHPRSGLAARHGVTLVNAPGTVDAGYRGEIKVTLINTDRDRPVSFRRGDRIAQLVIQRVERAVFHEVTVLPGSSRADGGFGSTGRRGGEGERFLRTEGPGGRQHWRTRRRVRSVSSASFSRRGSAVARRQRSGAVRRRARLRRAVRRRAGGTARWPRSRRRAAPGTRGRLSPRRSGWTSAACRCRSGPSTRSSSSWPNSTAPG